MLDRKSPPSFQKDLNFKLIPAKDIVLQNGIHCQFVLGGDQEVVKIDFTFNSGKWNEQKVGESYFLAHMLSKGTINRTSLEITTTLDHYGAHLEVQAGNDFTTLSLYALSKNASRLFDLMHEILTQPSLPESELQLLKSIYIQNLKINLEKTSFLASNQFRKNLFGANYPYGTDITANDVENITVSDLHSYFFNNYSDLVIQVSGYLSENDQNLLVKTFENIPVKRNIFQSHSIQTTTNRTIHFNKSESVQTSIRIGGLVVSRTHSDYPKLLLANHILGGYFGSRLMKNIREEKGLTYGIHSSLHILKNAAYMTIGADVNKDKRELTIEEIFKEIEVLKSKKISDLEFETAKNHFIGALVSDLSTPFAHAEKHKTIFLFNLPYNYYQELILKLNKVSQSDIQEVTTNYFSGLITITVG